MKEALDLVRLIILFFLRGKTGVEAIEAYDEVVACLRGELPIISGQSLRISQYVDFIARNFAVKTEDLINELETIKLKEIDINENDI